MNLRSFREEIWKSWSVFLIILAEIKREIPVGAESAKNSTCLRLHSEAEVVRKQIHRAGNPPPVAICERAALFTGVPSERE